MDTSFFKERHKVKTGNFIKEHSASIGLSLRIFDAFFLFTSGLLSFGLRFSHFNLPHTYKNVLLLGILFAVICFSSVGCYRGWRGTSFFKEAKSIVSATSLTFILLVISGFLTQSSGTFSRIWVISWLITASSLILLYRYSLRRILGLLRARGYNTRKVLIVGEGTLSNEVFNKLTSKEEFGLSVIGYLSDKDEGPGQLISNNFSRLGNIDELNSIISDEGVDQVWIAIPMSEIDTMKKVQSILAMSPVTIRFVPDIFGFQLLNHSITEVAGLPVINLSASHMLEGKNRFLKTLEDKVLSLVILILISPILLIIAAAIKLTSPGPIIFKQYRTGNNGRDFKVYKFRSMVVHFEKDDEVTQAKKGDARVTKLGAFLRRTSLDELPQFINVLQGRMSIVGPRPHALAHNQYYKNLVESYMRRHMVKPGITGWAQVCGFRGETDTLEKMQNRVKLDLYYIENWSIWFDLKIIILTVWKGFIHKNAF